MNPRIRRVVPVAAALLRAVAIAPWLWVRQIAGRGGAEADAIAGAVL